MITKMMSVYQTMHALFGMRRKRIQKDYDGMRSNRDDHLSLTSPKLHSQNFDFHFVLVHRQIWVRNYQIVEEAPTDSQEARISFKESGGVTPASTSLVEIGPRFVVDPIRIFRGSFGGQTLFQNAAYISPNEIRAAQRAQGNKLSSRKASKDQRKARDSQFVVPTDPLDSVFS
jgi:hypothetical protein